jgi:hypothetical protein
VISLNSLKLRSKVESSDADGSDTDVVARDINTDASEERSRAHVREVGMERRLSHKQLQLQQQQHLRMRHERARQQAALRAQRSDSELSVSAKRRERVLLDALPIADSPTTVDGADDDDDDDAQRRATCASVLVPAADCVSCEAIVPECVLRSVRLYSDGDA